MARKNLSTGQKMRKLYRTGWIASACLCFALCVPLHGKAATEILSGDWGDNIKYVLDSDMTLTFSGEGVMEDCNGYREYDQTGHSSWHDGAPWGQYIKQIKKVVVKEGITELGMDMVSYAEQLEKVELSDSVEVIGDEAFMCCNKLKSINWPKNLETIGDSSFYGCDQLTEIVFNDNLKSVGQFAFCESINIKKVVFPDGFETVGSNAFYACRRLTEVQFPLSLVNIGYESFAGCSKLQSVDVPCTVAIGLDSLPSKTKINKIHSYDKPEFFWGENPEECNVVLRCLENKEHKSIEKCTVTMKVIKYAKPGYNTSGSVKYTARYGKYKESKTVVVQGPYSVLAKQDVYTYTGKEIKPEIIVYDNVGEQIDSKYIKSVKYTYNKEIGRAWIDVKLTGLYKGSLWGTFIIGPKSTSIVSVEAKNRGLVVNWNKQDQQTTGYILQVATDPKFENDWKEVVFEKNTTLSGEVKELKKGKKYYIRICTYKKSGKTKYKSKWYVHPKAVKVK